MILYIRISPRNRETTQRKKIIKELGTIPYEYLHKLVNKKYIVILSYLCITGDFPRWFLTTSPCQGPSVAGMQQGIRKDRALDIV